MSLYTLHTLATGGQTVAAPTLTSAEETRLAVVDSSRGTSHPLERGTMPNDPETEKLVRDYVDAIASGVHEDVFAFYDDDIVYEDTAVRQTYRGIEATKEFYKKSMTALAVSWSVDTIVCHESGFGLAWVMTGRHELDLPGMPATGRTFMVPGASIAEVRGGKIVHNRDFWNNLDLLTQLGYRLTKPS